jgi:hypothetical protein
MPFLSTASNGMESQAQPVDARGFVPEQSAPGEVKEIASTFHSSQL